MMAGNVSSNPTLCESTGDAIERMTENLEDQRDQRDYIRLNSQLISQFLICFFKNITSFKQMSTALIKL